VYPGCGVGTVWRGIVPAVDEIVYRLLERLRAGAKPGFAWGHVDKGGTGQAQGLPLPERWGDGGDTADGGGGQAQGLPLLERLGGIMLARHLAGEACTGWLARAGRCGGAAPAQGRAEGPDAQRQGESEEERGERNFGCLIRGRESTDV